MFRYFWIALFGGAFVQFVPLVAEGISQGLSGAVYGVILILLITVMPSGAAGLFRRIAGASARDRNNPDRNIPNRNNQGGSDELETVSPAIRDHECEPHRPRRPAIGASDRAEEVPGRHG